MKKTLLTLSVVLITLFVFATDSAWGDETGLNQQAPVDWRFGIVETYEDPAAANASGAAWTRVRFQWAEVQAGGEGTWNHPTVSDAQIANEAASGRRVVGLLIGIPDWANENGLPRGLYAPIDDPANTWATFVRTSVRRYNGTINNWIIWNEPDVWDKNAPGHTWDGSVEDFVQLQKVAYLVAKQTNPNSTIHLSAFTWFWDANYGKEQYMGRMLDVILADPSAAENNYYFDVATAHLYFQPGLIYDIIGGFYGIMSSRGIFKPIWVVETNAPPSSDPAWPVPNLTFNVTLEEQARYIPQVMAMSLAAGAQRVAIYKLKDKDSDVGANPEPFGLIRRDGSRRPGFNSYRIGVNYMRGVQSAQRERWDDVGIVKLTQENQTTHVMFTRTQGDRFVQVEATSDTALLVDMYGAQRALTAENGFFGVNLPAANCSQIAGEYCMIGGHTYYLVQGATGGGVSAPVTQEEADVPTAEAPAADVPTADVPTADTPTVEPSPTPTATIAPTDTPAPTETLIPPTETAVPPTATPTPTKTLRPTVAIFPDDGAGQDEVEATIGADQVVLPDSATPTPPVVVPSVPSAVNRPWISAGDLLGYGLILIGVGLIWLFLLRRNS